MVVASGGFSWLAIWLTYLAHLPLDNMAAILETIFSDAVLWMKILVFWLKFHWSLSNWQWFSIGLDIGDKYFLSISNVMIYGNVGDCWSWNYHASGGNVLISTLDSTSNMILHTYSIIKTNIEIKLKEVAGVNLVLLGWLWIWLPIVLKAIPMISAYSTVSDFRDVTKAVNSRLMSSRMNQHLNVVAAVMHRFHLPPEGSLLLRSEKHGKRGRRIHIIVKRNYSLV